MALLIDAEAKSRMEAHHGQLVAGVADAVQRFELACLSWDGAEAEAAAAHLESLLEGDVLPHAAGEEVSLYAAAQPLNGALVRSLIEEHDTLRGLIAACKASTPDLGRPAGRLRYLGLAHAVSALFGAHAGKEDRFITPLLLERTPAGTLARLFAEMHAAPVGA